METLVLNVKSKNDLKFLEQLLSRMGITAKKLSESEKEDFALNSAITEGRESGYVSEKEVMKTLKTIFRK